MRTPTLLMSATVITGLIAQAANAQSAGLKPRAKKAPATIGATETKASYLRGRAQRSLAATPRQGVASRPSKRVASRPSSPVGTLVNEPSGRIDKSGRPVAFYPSSRSLRSSGTQTSASRQPAAAAPPVNPQKDVLRSRR
jgi:hypothetical protein